MGGVVLTLLGEEGVGEVGVALALHYELLAEGSEGCREVWKGGSGGGRGEGASDGGEGLLEGGDFGVEGRERGESAGGAVDVGMRWGMGRVGE